MSILLYEHLLKVLHRNSRNPFSCRGCGNDIEVGDWLIITPLEDLHICRNCNELIRDRYKYCENKETASKAKHIG